MEIRLYEPEDDPALMALERMCPRGLPEPFVHYRRRFVDRAALFADYEVLVVERDGEIIGTGAVSLKDTHVGGESVRIGYIFDIRTNPSVRRQGVGQTIVLSIEDYLISRGAHGAYGHIVSSNVASLKLFAKLGYTRLRQLMLLNYQPSPAFDVPEWMPRHSDYYYDGNEYIEETYCYRDLYVPDTAEAVAHYGFQHWTLDFGGADVASISVYDQSYVFQQWPAHLPFPTEEEMAQRGMKNLRLFNQVGMHRPSLLQTIFDTLRDIAVADSVGKLSLLIDRLDRIPQFFFEESDRQLDYWMVFKVLDPVWEPRWQDAPMYIDTREL
ncbi:MAG TPA: GNAT family N-acetyltransferase [Aggregatilinea sp.]|jgi:ribosomal protein S18 acetylase RimI-like enzyme|uniref:GNAT family N-acetyltransferase n=1 Tax=Aggregatilinea sp. TaxID=2806333 RepID=UPI002C5E2ADB|nr:GNAT family N-acetyltransferase [Aggregatilinea sp.]HML23148.1 GNAT family N-acetyltransferase [Aggregatilinea sp.]